MCQPIPSQWSNCFYDLIFHLIKFLHEPFVSLIKFLLNYLILSNSIFDFFYKDIDTFSCFNFVQFCNFFFPLPFDLCGLQQLYFSIPSFVFFLLFLHSPYLYLYSIFHCFFLSLPLDPQHFIFVPSFFSGLCTCSPPPPSLLPCFLFFWCVCELIIFSFPLSLFLLSFPFSLLLPYFSLLNVSLFGLLFAFLSLCLFFFCPSFPFRHLSLKYAISALFGSYSYFINLFFSSSLLCFFVELFNLHLCFSFYVRDMGDSLFIGMVRFDNDTLFFTQENECCKDHSKCLCNLNKNKKENVLIE